MTRTYRGHSQRWIYYNNDHITYWQILHAFMEVYKAGAMTTASMHLINGAAAQGTF